MKTAKLKSSRISSVNYYENELTLLINFTDGKSYEYYKVPLSVYSGLVNAASAGKYFNASIKGKYSYEKA